MYPALLYRKLLKYVWEKNELAATYQVFYRKTLIFSLKIM